MECVYAIFCEDCSINSATAQISATGFFSQLELDSPGTTKFNFVVGISGIPEGKKVSLKILINDPVGKTFAGEWDSPKSETDIEVYNAIFNCSTLPLNKEGVYTFQINRKMKQLEEMCTRKLKVTFKSGLVVENE